MPDQHRIKGELQGLLSRPQYSSLFAHQNQFRKPGTAPITPEKVSAETAEYLWRNNPLLDPVEVLELRGPLRMYRAYDGGVRLYSARTLGRSWFEERVAESIWEATAKHPTTERRRWYLEFLRTANFVLPEWNAMLEIAVMSVPVGVSVVAARGKGNWRALRTPSAKISAGAARQIGTADDVMLKLGMMPIPGTAQCIVPIFNDNWVTQVSKSSTQWPLFS